MKRITKIMSCAMAALMLCLSLAACGGSGSSGSGAIKTTFTTIRPAAIEAMGWYTDEVFTLQLNDNNTYQLIYHTNRFGGEDLEMRGVRTITFFGKCTSAPSADGEPSHLDISMEAPTQITWEQHGKGFTRVQTLPGIFFINTSAWTDAMTAIYDVENNTKGASDFLAEFGKAMTITVEDASVDPEDTTLTNRIVTLPEMGILFEVEAY